MGKKKSAQAIIVSHTHWDRAWYLPFEEFCFRLVRMVDRIISLLMNDKDFKCFVLDGQTILIEDYLDIRPENKQKLASLIRSGQLVIGPWYILPDLFLASGESTIRNLQIGHEMSKQFGGKMDVGYVPDPFGHIAQLPQILQGFGISTFIFMRGMPEEVIKKNTLLFNWAAPNGSSVLAYYTKDGYLNAANLGYEKEIGRYDLEKPSPEKSKERIERTTGNLKTHFPNNLFLLNNGMDHMPEQPEMPALVQHFNESNSEIEIRQGTFSDFMNLAKSEPTSITYSGNLLGNPDHPILQSVYSSRSYLKQQNQKAQGMLEKITEPLSLISACLSNSDVPYSFIEQSWKTLLKNHPHDDICGCSTDAVHEDNEARFRHVMEISKSICTDSLEKMQKSGFTPFITSQNDPTKKRNRDVFVFNPHPFDQTSWIETDVVFPNLEGEEEEVLEEYLLKAFDAGGKELTLEILETEAPYLKAEFIQFTWGRRYRVRVKVKVPSLGYHLITIQEYPHPPGAKLTAQLREYVENDRYSVSWNQSAISVFDKKSDTRFSDFIRFEFIQDNGDTYSFSRASKEIFSNLIEVKAGKYHQSISAVFSIQIPKKITSSKKVELTIEVFFDLSFNDQIRLRLNYENSAENGRLRILLPLGFNTDESYADGHFVMNINTSIKEQAPDDYQEVYDQYPGELNYPTHFMGDFCFSKGINFNTWVGSKGLHEYQLLHGKETGFFAVTLHRSVGFLSVGNGSIRRPHAGPKIKVPGAQCLRPYHIELCWGTTTSSEYEINQKAVSFSHPLYVRELSVFKGKPIEGSLPRTAGFLSILDKRIRLSSLKQANDSTDIIIRIYNLSPEHVSTEIDTGFKYSEFCITDFYEHWNDQELHKFSEGKMHVELEPHQIKTYRLRKQR